MIATTLALAGGTAAVPHGEYSLTLQSAVRFVMIVALACLSAANCGDVLATDVVPVAYTSSVPALAPSFRVETDVFEGTQLKPQSQHLLLFDSGVVYDLPIGPGATLSVFDPLRSRVMLLHKIQRVRTSISTESLIQISAQARAAAAAAGSEKSLGLNARVTSSDTPDSCWIEFANTKYTATTQPELAEGVSAAYAAFTVWACRLNIARHVGSPPFARMTLADYLAAERALPRQIKLDVRLGLKTRTYRSENLYVGRLSDLDRKKISDVGEMIASYTEVEFAAFPID